MSRKTLSKNPKNPSDRGIRNFPINQFLRMPRIRDFFLFLSISINLMFFLYILNSDLFNKKKYYKVFYDDSNIPMNEANYSGVEIKEHIKCYDKDLEFKITQRGHFVVLNNYVLATLKFKCDESITYSTHADFTYLDNLVTLVQRWDGPVSLALHAPGHDFDKAIASIFHLRRCGPKKIKELVTFHIYFRNGNFPVKILQKNELSQAEIETDCNSLPPFANSDKKQTYTYLNGLFYPVNVGRNIARENAMTHYILVSDIELFPNPGIIPKFLKLVDNLPGNRLKVYPLPVFEIGWKNILPINKTQLATMIKNGSAQIFHKTICPSCHRIPHFGKWLNRNDGDVNIFHVAKRENSLSDWEPIYIGTNSEPFYDERLTWEGKRDKMTQGYIMCVLNYEFHILDNAFLIHKPGIKRMRSNFFREYTIQKTYAKMYEVIHPELKVLFGDKEECKL